MGRKPFVHGTGRDPEGQIPRVLEKSPEYLVDTSGKPKGLFWFKAGVYEGSQRGQGRKGVIPKF